MFSDSSTDIDLYIIVSSSECTMRFLDKACTNKSKKIITLVNVIKINILRFLSLTRCEIEFGLTVSIKSCATFSGEPNCETRSS